MCALSVMEGCDGFLYTYILIYTLYRSKETLKIYSLDCVHSSAIDEIRDDKVFVS